ncbi:hypothetical protein L9F63_003678, partial [Diploptera punctata]
IAILLLGNDAFTKTVTQLCGEQQLKQRISTSLWNSMYMSDFEAKVTYLREKIWPSTSGSHIGVLDISS